MRVEVSDEFARRRLLALTFLDEGAVTAVVHRLCAVKAWGAGARGSARGALCAARLLDIGEARKPAGNF